MPEYYSCQASSVKCVSQSLDQLSARGLHSRKTSQCTENHLSQNLQAGGQLHGQLHGLGQVEESDEMKAD